MFAVLVGPVIRVAVSGEQRHYVSVDAIGLGTGTALSRRSKDFGKVERKVYWDQRVQSEREKAEPCSPDLRSPLSQLHLIAPGKAC